jgi:Fuc2NAc and GlcNAc transferase
MLLLPIVVCVGSFAITWIVRIIAIRKSILDIPNDRSSHTIPTPRGGGLAVAISWFAGITWFFISGKLESSLFFGLLCGIPLTLVGFADDIFNLKPGVRFLVQFICAAGALFSLKGLQFIQVGMWNLECGMLFFPIAFIAIVWAINLFNFLDGIDGYIGTELVFIGVASFLLAGQSVGILLAASVLGFLFWNWPKAKIFMGDVGSTLLGFTVAILAIYHQNSHLLNLPVWLILTSVFWYDATLTLWRRFRNKEQLSQAHRKHAYQRLVQSGWSHQKTTLGALSINVVAFGLAYLAHRYSTLDWLFLVVNITLLSIAMRYIDHRMPFEKK